MVQKPESGLAAQLRDLSPERYQSLTVRAERLAKKLQSDDDPEVDREHAI